jgi:hypothetical protein
MICHPMMPGALDKGYSPSCLEEEFSEVRGSNLSSLGSGPRGMGPAHSLCSPRPARMRYICGEQTLRAVATCYAPTSPRNSQREAATLAKRRRWPIPPPGHRGAFAFVILTLQDREVARNHVAYVSSCISSAKLEGVGTGPHTVLLGRLTGRESRVGDTWSLQTALEGTGFISREPKGNALGLDGGPFLGAVGHSSDRRRRVGGRRGRGYVCTRWQTSRRILVFCFFGL